jgi:hypothetical protein
VAPNERRKRANEIVARKRQRHDAIALRHHQMKGRPRRKVVAENQ